MAYLDNKGLAYFWDKLKTALSNKQDTFTTDGTLAIKDDILSISLPNKAITTAEYDALSEEEKMANVQYIITDDDSNSDMPENIQQRMVMYASEKIMTISGGSISLTSSGTGTQVIHVRLIPVGFPDENGIINTYKFKCSGTIYNSENWANPSDRPNNVIMNMKYPQFYQVGSKGSASDIYLRFTGEEMLGTNPGSIQGNPDYTSDQDRVSVDYSTFITQGSSASFELFTNIVDSDGYSYVTLQLL